MAGSGTRVMRANGIESRRLLLEAAGRVFARLAYSEARLKDIADDAGISQGSLYFHFGTKEDIANAVLEVQNERMRQVLAVAREANETGLARLLQLFVGLAELVATDGLVQAGIRLSMQPGTGLETVSRAPYLEWIAVASTILEDGIEDGSIEPQIDVAEMAELLNELFIGAQTLSGIEDSWKSLPRRVSSARKYLRSILRPSATPSGG